MDLWAAGLAIPIASVRDAFSRFVWRGLFGFCTILLAASCKLGPDYARPSVESPAGWRWKAGEPKDHAPRGAWWTVFNDPALNALQAAATERNQDLRAAAARVEQARATARMSRADFYPSLQGQASYSRYRTSGNAPSPVPFPVPSFTQSQWQVPFDLSYEIDLWGRVRRSFEAARHVAAGAEAARQSMLLSLQADVAANYLAFQTLELEVGLLESAISLRKEALAAFEQRRDAGIGNEFEVQRAKVEVAAAAADFSLAQRRRAETVNALAVLCGSSPAEFQVPASTAPHVLPEIAPDLPSALLERRPDIAEAERQLAARLAQIGVAKGAFFPSIRLTAAGGFLSGEVSDLFRWDSRVWSLGPGISWPLFQGGRNRAELERTRAAYDESVAVYRQRILVAFREVEDSLSGLQLLRSEVLARQEAAAAATSAMQLSMERYRAGSINFLEVVDSENARLINELARLRAAHEQRLATVRLIKALGGGWNNL
jgi:multidrug efflux system outer membrane protein